MSQALYAQVNATLDRLQRRHPDLKEALEKAYGYAVFPSVGRASAVVGVSHGKGIVFEQGEPIGIATITGLTVGVQVGGQTFSEVLIFPDKAAVDRLQRGEVAFAANASAVLVKAAASGTADFHGVVAKAYSQGGMLVELSIGGQKLSFKPSLEEIRQAPAPEVGPPVASSSEQGGQGAATDQPHAQESAGEAHGVAQSFAKAAQAVAAAAQPAVHQAEAAVSEVQQQAGAAKAHVSDAAEGVAAKAGEAVEHHRGLAERVEALLRRAATSRVVPGPLKRGLGSAGKRLSEIQTGLAKEQKVNKMLHPEAQAVVAHLIAKNQGLREELEKAKGFAIFPSVGKAGAVLGATYGLGEVFEGGRLIGYAALAQITLGVQVGGDTFIELVIFNDDAALERFKRGKVGFAANASAVLVKAGAAASNHPSGTKVMLSPDGGMLVEAALGGQKFVYRDAALTRGTTLRMEGARAQA